MVQQPEEASGTEVSWGACCPPSVPLNIQLCSNALGQGHTAQSVGPTIPFVLVRSTESQASPDPLHQDLHS